MKMQIKYLIVICLCCTLFFAMLFQIRDNEDRFFFPQQDGSMVKVTIEKGRGIKTLKDSHQVKTMVKFKEKTQKWKTPIDAPISFQDMGGNPVTFKVEFVDLEGEKQVYWLANDRYCVVPVDEQRYTLSDDSKLRWYKAQESFYAYTSGLY